MNYSVALALISVTTNIILMYFVKQNKSISKRTRKGFIISFSIIILGVVLHFLSVIALNSFYKMLILFLKYAIIPLAPAIFAWMVFDEKYIPSIGSTILRIYFCVYEFCILIMLLSHSHINFVTLAHWPYAITFLISALYLFVRTFAFSKIYQNTNKSELILVICFLVLGIAIQLLNPELQISWLTISIASFFMYVYNNELAQSTDGLTSLLNQHCFANDWQSIKERAIVIVLDVNDFKQINDIYGHLKGDEILRTLASLLKNNYGKYGKVYRMGGDEFSIILTQNLDNFDKLNQNLISTIQKLKETQPEFPHVSYGSAMYEPSSGKSKQQILEEADFEMYEFKKILKHKK